MTRMRDHYHTEPIAYSSEATVVARYEALPRTEDGYQSEAALEEGFIRQLQGQGYQRLDISSEEELKANLRTQLERLNKVTFTDGEWNTLFSSHIARSNEGILEKTRKIQGEDAYALQREDGTLTNIRLIDRRNIHNNRLQVVNQYEAIGTRQNRYDVTVLVNGLPLVHVELKRRGVEIREAFRQIDRYQRDSFWSGSGLFEYVQIFVISNGTHTKYYSNTVRHDHVHKDALRGRSKSKAAGGSFEFTSWWADAKNHRIADLTDYTATFFSRHVILAILTRYCVFSVDNKLRVMRPYQIAAAESILQRIQIATTQQKLGTEDAGGYIWHTTGSGKTLTSFKTARLACDLTPVDKVFFVVDRKDLDHQTIREYNNFQEGCVTSNKDSKKLKALIESSDPSAKIIVTTIQKLSRFVSTHKKHPVYGKHVVMIFDECHRSQFGSMHQAITRAFKRYHVFGFTGTPIFPENAVGGVSARELIAKGGSGVSSKTTDEVFGDRLHTYTIINAIDDKNVLPFQVDFNNTIHRVDGESEDRKVKGIDVKEALLAPERIESIVSYTLDNFDIKTHRGQGRKGFNSLFAVDSIEAAKAYYAEFVRQLEALPPEKRLDVAIIYSYNPNEDLGDAQMEEEELGTEGLDPSSRGFLDRAIDRYNKRFNTNYDTGAGFEGYYHSVSEKLKEGELDMLIVVAMFLTGFDAPGLNTVWADKNLRMHGLIQAFSRTNRILDSTKQHGNIVAFRDLKDEMNTALSLFGDSPAKSIAILEPYHILLDRYNEAVKMLQEAWPLDEQIVGESAKKAFIKHFGEVLKQRNTLSTFVDFQRDEPITDRDIQDYSSRYLDAYDEFRRQQGTEKESILNDVSFHVELIKQIEVNVDYILHLVSLYIKDAHKSEGPSAESAMDARRQIDQAVNASPSLRSKKALIDRFIEEVTVSRVQDEAVIANAWPSFVEKEKGRVMDALIFDENLKPKEARRFFDTSLESGEITEGQEFTNILPRLPRFTNTNNHQEKRQRVLTKMRSVFNQFFGL